MVKRRVFFESRSGEVNTRRYSLALVAGECVGFCVVRFGNNFLALKSPGACVRAQARVVMLSSWTKYLKSYRATLHPKNVRVDLQKPGCNLVRTSSLGHAIETGVELWQ